MKEKKIVLVVLFILGLMLISSGIFFKIRNWPDAFHGIYTGSFLILISLILFIILKFKK